MEMGYSYLLQPIPNVYIQTNNTCQQVLRLACNRNVSVL